MSEILSNKYERLKADLETVGTGKMKVFGNSMTPILTTGVELTFVKQDSYQVGDIVFSRVKGRYIDAHKITAIDGKGRYLISNNHGWDNGWTKKIFGKAITAEYSPDNIQQL